jgi:chemotaxis protein methyltransferase CheR
MGRTAARRSLRLWSAGCSTGEEAYSIAAVLLDTGAASAGWHFEVLGTDVSTRALELARTGIYPERSLAGLPAEFVARHFESAGPDRVRARERVRRLVGFRYHNLIKEPYPLSLMGEWDVIFCRNVTIYFKVESTRRVVNNLLATLVPGGYLFLGHSETLTAISADFDTVEHAGVYLYRKPVEPPKLVLAEAPLASRQERVVRRASRGGPMRPISGNASPRSARRETTEEVRRLAHEGAQSLVAGKAREALLSARRMAELDPSSPESPLLEARVLAEEGDLDGAAAASERALATNPLLPGARYLLGLVEQRRGDAEAAERELRKTVYIDPGFALAHLNLGTLYRGQGRWDMACEAYEAAVRAAREGPQGRWTAFLGGFDVDTLVRTAKRGLVECRKASGKA